MKRPNALPPELMTPTGRRAELCGLLAAGLVRLRSRDIPQISATNGEFPLHNSVDQSGSATPTKRRPA